MKMAIVLFLSKCYISIALTLGCSPDNKKMFLSYFIVAFSQPSFTFKKKKKKLTLQMINHKNKGKYHDI